MFGLLKKKLEGFTQKLKEKVFEKPPERAPQAEAHAKGEEPKAAESVQAIAEKHPSSEKAENAVRLRQAKQTVAAEEPAEAKPVPVEPRKVSEEVKTEKPAKHVQVVLKESREFSETSFDGAPETGAKEASPPAVPKPEHEAPSGGAPREVKGRELKAKVSLGEQLKSIFSGTVTVSEKEISGLLEELELALLEADVEPETAEGVCAKIKSELAGKKIDKNRFEEIVKQEIRKSLLEVMHAEKIDVVARINSKAEKPFVILFLGPNGAGKTTTIAKIAHYLKGKGIESVLAASDTFRAASIEQIGVHGERLGVRVVKHNYGSDPAAVAFDAVQAAKAKGVPVVLVDSAGRQETNKNLMKEVEKIVRVAKPDLKLFVGEALAGHSLIEQAKEFDRSVGLDGFVLTKIDTDAKGGTTISLIYNLKKPVLFIGTGQGYGDLVEFRPEFIVDRAVA